MKLIKTFCYINMIIFLLGHARAQAVVPYRMQLLAGDNQSGNVTSTLPDPLQVKVSDANGNPVPDVYVAFLSNYEELILRPDSTNFTGFIWKEAEEGTIIPPAQIETAPGVSMGSYIQVPVDNANYNRGRVDLLLRVPETNFYRLWLRLVTPANNAKSFYIQVDDEEPVLWKRTVATEWHWDTDHADYHFTAGIHTLTILGREPGVKFDKILLTRDGNYQPVGIGEGLPYRINTHLLWQEAERSLISNPMEVYQDNEASSNYFVNVPIVDGNYGRGRAAISFYPVNSGKYKLWLRNKSPGGTSNSIKIQVDDQTEVNWSFEEKDHWDWALFPNELSLEKGLHTINVLGREPGTQVDKLLLTDSLSYIPAGKGESASYFGFSTDENGVASGYAYLGRTAGNFVVYAVAPGLVGNPVHFNLSVTSQQATFLHTIAGENQVAPVASVLPESLAVRVTDYLGCPAPGRNVEFKVIKGNGHFDGSTQVVKSTDTLGQVALFYTLATTAGPGVNEITVTAFNDENQPLLGSPVLFRPVGSALSAAKMKIHSGNYQVGLRQMTLPVPLSVAVTDAYENGRHGIFVKFMVQQGKASLSTDTFNFDKKIWKEAEDATIIPPMVTKAAEDASARSFITVPVADGNYKKGCAEVLVFVPQWDCYTLWLRVKAPDDAANSLYTIVANGDTIEWKLTNSTSWIWQKNPGYTDYWLKRGLHSVKILGREPGTQIDKILLSADATYEPNGKGLSTLQFGAYSDSNGIAQTEITFGDSLGWVFIQASNDTLQGSPLLFKVEVLDTLIEPVDTTINDNLPGAFVLHQNYPNPFVGPAGGSKMNANKLVNQSNFTRIQFDLSKPATITLSIFNLEGRLVKTLVQNYYNPGLYGVNWDGYDLNGFPVAAGIYFYQLEVADGYGQKFFHNRRMAILH